MFDRTLFNFLHDLAGKNGLLDLAGIFFAEYLGYFVVLSVLVWFILERDWRKRFNAIALTVLSAIIARGIIAEILKFAFARPRPGITLKFIPLIDAPQSFAFPSGHATFFFAVVVAVWFYNRKWGNWFLIAAALISIARVFVGVHWPLDVVGGAVVGIVGAMIAKQLLARARKTGA
jgi:undecaprenyl-diphosphatase